MRRLSQPGDILVAELASVLLEDQRSGGLIGQGEGDGRVKAAGRREEKEVSGEGKRSGTRQPKFVCRWMSPWEIERT